MLQSTYYMQFMRDSDIEVNMLQDECGWEHNDDAAVTQEGNA